MIHRNFEKDIIVLIEAKHKKCVIGDTNWKDAMKQGKEKSKNKHLPYYIVTNTIDSVRFYNSANDAEITIDNEVIVKFQNLDILIKLKNKINAGNSNLDTRKEKIKINEAKFRLSLKKLENIYRSVKLDSKEKIQSTISFMVIKYISDKEDELWSFNNAREEGLIKLWNDFNGNFKNEFKNAIHNFLSGDFGGDYIDFKKLVFFSEKLNNTHYKLIYDELTDYYLHGADFDLFGVVYEEFADSGEKKKFGEYYTRRHITKTIAKILLREEKDYKENLKICDPCCGTGGFLTEAFKVLKGNYERNNNLSKKNMDHLKSDIFYGYDDREESIARTELNMFLVGDGHTNIKQRDTIKNYDEHNGLEEAAYDYILSNPPYGVYKGDEPITNFQWTNEKRSEMMFIERIVKATKHGGKIAIVIPDGILEAPSRESFRLKLLNSVDIEAIISLPKFSFAPYTKEKTYVLFMKRKQKEYDNKLQTSPIWHYIVDYDGYANSDNRYETRRKNDEGNFLHFDLPELEIIFDAKKDTKKEINNEAINKSKLVDISEVNKSNFHNLLSEFYLRPFNSKTINISDFDKEFRRIKKIFTDFGNK